MVNVPLISFLLSATGDPFRTFAVLGLSYAVLIGGAAWFVRHPPEDGGHAGREPPVPETGDEEHGRGAKGGSYDLGGALRTWQWYAIWVMFFLNTTVGLAVYSDAEAMAGSIAGSTAAAASAFVVVVSLADTAGRLVWPILSDRIGGAGVFLAMFVLQAAALALMPLVGAGSFVAFCVLASAVLSCYGGGYATMSALSGAYFGTRDIGTIYGSIVLASGVASFGAPVLLARSADVTGSYDLALYAMGGLMLAGCAIPLALRPPASPRSPGRQVHFPGPGLRPLAQRAQTLYEKRVKPASRGASPSSWSVVFARTGILEPVTPRAGSTARGCRGRVAGAFGWARASWGNATGLPRPALWSRGHGV